MQSSQVAILKKISLKYSQKHDSNVSLSVMPNYFFIRLRTTEQNYTPCPSVGERPSVVIKALQFIPLWIPIRSSSFRLDRPGSTNATARRISDNARVPTSPACLFSFLTGRPLATCNAWKHIKKIILK
jgi:hypothetical protein